MLFRSFINLYILYTVHASFIIHRSMSYILHPATINPHMYMYARIQHIVKTSMSAADIPSELTLRRVVRHAGFWMSLGPACRLADRPSELTLCREVQHAGLPASRIYLCICRGSSYDCSSADVGLPTSFVHGFARASTVGASYLLFLQPL